MLSRAAFTRCCSSHQIRQCPSKASSPLATPSTCRRLCSSSEGKCPGCCKSFAARPQTGKALGRKVLAPPPEALGIYYSTTTGKTQEVADKIKEILGDAANEPVDIGDVSDLSAAMADPALDGLIVGAPTWNTGADEGRSGTSWDNVLAQVSGLDLTGRKVAVFGCGDQYSYGDYFCDAMEELYSSFAAAGCEMVGHWPTKGYEHSESKAEIEPGVFCGLALDEDNQDDQTEQRVATWTAQVLKEMGVEALV